MTVTLTVSEEKQIFKYGLKTARAGIVRFPPPHFVFKSRPRQFSKDKEARVKPGFFYVYGSIMLHIRQIKRFSKEFLSP